MNELNIKSRRGYDIDNNQKILKGLIFYLLYYNYIQIGLI